MQGWTILPTSDSIRFTNGATGHGMFIGSAIPPSIRSDS
jgi:hypothetical protein